MEQKNNWGTDLWNPFCSLLISSSYKLCVEENLEYVTLDALMICLGSTEEGRKFFDAMHLDAKKFAENAMTFLRINVPKLKKGEFPKPASSLGNLLENTIILHKASGNKGEINEKWILVALVEVFDQNSFTYHYFRENRINRYHIMNYAAHNKGRPQPNNPGEKNVLDRFAVNLNDRAKKNPQDRLIGREREIDEMIKTLCRRKKNNPVLVGEPGVGKTVIAEGLAQKIVDGDVPEPLKDMVIYSLNISSMVAGSQYRGSLEERLEAILRAAAKNPKIIIFIDEIHSAMTANSGLNGSVGVPDILKPALASGSIRVIGASTENEYRKHIESDGALARRFQKVVVSEPSKEDSFAIISGIKEHYEKFHGVTYTDDAIRAAIDLSVKFVPNKHLPDKAVDVIDVAGSSMKLEKAGSGVIDADYINSVFAKMLKLPVDKVNQSESKKLKDLDNHLKSQIFGQDAAIEKVVDKIILAKSNIQHRDKPIASLLFAGPTGVGKTELAKQISKQLEIPLIRFDMSEYMQQHSVSKLIGSPAGYVAYEEGGQLTNTVRKNPHCVLLLDEIEKAHPDIFNILLQVMDYGSLKENNGKIVDFKNVLLIMTSNLGADAMNKPVMGFTSQASSVDADRDQKVKKSFSPEFFNRLDDVIHFNALKKDTVESIVRKTIDAINKNLEGKKVSLSVSDTAIRLIAEKGFDAQLGARPIERFIEKKISQEIAKEIVFGQLLDGGHVNVDVADGEIVISYAKQEEVQPEPMLAVEIPKPRVRKRLTLPSSKKRQAE